MKPTPNFDRIQPQFCINAKLRKLHRLINSAYQAKINPFGLRGSMLSILFIIGNRKNVNQKTLADLLVLDQSTISRDIKRLVEKKWVKVKKGDDPRNTELQLTNHGHDLLEEVSPIWEELHKKMEKLLGSFNIHQIDTISSVVRTNIDELKF